MRFEDPASLELGEDKGVVDVYLKRAGLQHGRLNVVAQEERTHHVHPLVFLDFLESLGGQTESVEYLLSSKDDSEECVLKEPDNPCD